MSTKIYAAYKLKNPLKFTDVVDDLYKIAIKKWEKRIIDLLHEAMKDVKDDNEDYLKSREQYYNQSEEFCKAEVACDFVQNGYRAQKNSPYRDLFDFDAWITFYWYDGEIYLIPRCDMAMRDLFNFLMRHRELQDFRYWNNTDKPSHIRVKEWKHRQDIWDLIFPYSGEIPPNLRLGICEPDYFWRIFPHLKFLRKYSRK